MHHSSLFRSQPFTLTNVCELLYTFVERARIHAVQFNSHTNHKCAHLATHVSRECRRRAVQLAKSVNEASDPHSRGPSRAIPACQQRHRAA